MIKSVSILGLRGFATKQTLELAIPNGQPGSGLTIVVGANNAGKSTTIEALRALGVAQDMSFTAGKRNHKAGDRIELSLTATNDETAALKSVAPGSSETERGGAHRGKAKILAIPSRRAFAPYFGKSEYNRDAYRGHNPSQARPLTSDTFSYRLFKALKNQKEFNEILARVIDPVPTWTIDQDDNNQYFVKISMEGATHTSEGAGEGFVSLLFLIDALYDSAEQELIAFDEPELSLHPSVQRRLSRLMMEYAATRQIVVATHSPYFANVDALNAGGRIVRSFRADSGCELAHLSVETGKRLYKASLDANNPHMMGLDAREVFFMDDKIIIVEGQEDVMFLDKALASIDQKLNGSMFGWGAGGAEKIELLAQVFSELGFKKVVGFVDANKHELLPSLRGRFKNYFFEAIPADDIRTKPAVKARDARPGLLDDDNKSVRQQHLEAFTAVTKAANLYFDKKAQ